MGFIFASLKNRTHAQNLWFFWGGGDVVESGVPCCSHSYNIEVIVWSYLLEFGLLILTSMAFSERGSKGLVTV